MVTRSRKIAAWGVHAYTAMGLPLAFLSTIALFEGDARMFFLLNMLAVFVDATDGTLARKVVVWEVVPEFDGRRLDDIVDFITFAFLPALALPVLGLFPEGWRYAAFAPLLASGYGFCQERAKTDESFVGFPSYWNIVLLYLYVLSPSTWINLATVLLFSVLVFVPIHYVYPTKTKLLKPVTLVGGVLWALAMVAVAASPNASWSVPLAWLSTLYPVYYFVVSGVNHVRVHKGS